MLNEQVQQRHLQVEEISAGDQVIFRGHQYWVALVITMPDKSKQLALRQAHWLPGYVRLVPKNEVLPDFPFTA